MTHVLENDRVRVVIDAQRGARVSALSIDGHEILARASAPGVAPEIADGVFAMVPWAGRIRDGRIEADGVVHQLPHVDGDNALHGLGHVRPWLRESDGVYTVSLGSPWPTEGTATLTYTLLPGGLRIDLTWHDGTDQPCSIGLHPWFRRRLETGEELVADLRPTVMVERGADALPTGRLVAPRPGPWDDCFALASDPVLTWPGALELTLRSSAEWWVVYDEPSDTVCVEPQTAPPDAFGHPSLQPDGSWPRAVWFELIASS